MCAFLVLHYQADVLEPAETAQVGGVIAVENDPVQTARVILQDLLGVLHLRGDLGPATAFHVRRVDDLAGGEQHDVRTDQPRHGDGLPDPHAHVEGNALRVFQVVADDVGRLFAVRAVHLDGGDAMRVNDGVLRKIDHGIGNEAGCASRNE